MLLAVHSEKGPSAGPCSAVFDGCACLSIHMGIYDLILYSVLGHPGNGSAQALGHRSMRHRPCCNFEEPGKSMDHVSMDSYPSIYGVSGQKCLFPTTAWSRENHEATPQSDFRQQLELMKGHLSWRGSNARHSIVIGLFCFLFFFC